MYNPLKKLFRKHPEFPSPRAVDRAVPAWTNKDASVRYVPELGTGVLPKDSPVMAGLKSPHGNFRLCEILNHVKGIKMYGWIAEADLSFTAPVV